MNQRLSHGASVIVSAAIVMLSPGLGCYQAAAFEGDIEGKAVVHPAITPYVQFLDSAKTDPVDYVMGLFEKADIVILCERFHAEATQYDLFLRLVSDPRFTGTVGRVFTEVGTSSLRPYVRDFLHASDIGAGAVQKRLTFIYQHISWFPAWEKSNFFGFLKNVYLLNNTLPENRKVDILPSDLPFSWDGMTAEKYREFERKVLGNRDRIMADQIISAFDGILRAPDPRKKALVIMNYRHAFNNGNNTGRYLFERYPGRVANVLINTVVPLPGSNDHKTVIGLVHEGKWDAAFAVAGNPSVGFNMRGSPFGADSFDLFPFRPSDAKYEQVFTGFIFYLPLQEHRHEVGTPGLVDDGFAPVLMERMKIAGKAGDMTLEDFKRLARDLATATVLRYNDNDPSFDLNKLLERWLRPDGPHPSR